jgi:hypothetical protein
VTARVTTPTRQAAPPSDPAAAPPSDPSATTNAFAPPAAAAAAPMSVLHVIRDPGTTVALEVRLRATGRTDLPDLLVELPEGVRDVLAPLRGEIGSAHYDVIDASPFAAPCPGGGGCVRFAE